MSSIMRWRSGLTVLVSLMESSILSEVDDPSIPRTGLPRRYACPLNWLPASRLLPRAAGWSAATLCLGTNRTNRAGMMMSDDRGKPEVVSRMDSVRYLGKLRIVTCISTIETILQQAINKLLDCAEHSS